MSEQTGHEPADGVTRASREPSPEVVASLGQLRTFVRSLDLDDLYHCGNELAGPVASTYLNQIGDGDAEAASRAAYGLADLLRNNHDERGALRLLAAIHDFGSPRYRPLARLDEAALRHALGDTAGAERCLSEVADSPYHDDVVAEQYVRARWMKEEGKVEDALGLLRQATAAGDSTYYGRAALTLGLLLDESDRSAEAARWFREAATDPHWEVAGRAVVNLVEILITKGDETEGAMALVDDVVRRFATDVLARREVATMLAYLARRFHEHDLGTEEIACYDLTVAHFAGNGNEEVSQWVARAVANKSARLVEMRRDTALDDDSEPQRGAAGRPAIPPIDGG